MKLNWLYIAWRNVGLKKLQTALSLVLLAFGVGLVSLLMLSEKQLSDTFDRNIKDIDLVLGAKGSPLQLILANVYHVDAPTGNIRLADAEKVIRHPYIAEGIPLAYGDNYRGYRIVGSTDAYTEHYGGRLAEGRRFEASFEVVVGAKVAEVTGLKVGDEFSVHTDCRTRRTCTPTRCSASLAAWSQVVPCWINCCTAPSPPSGRCTKGTGKPWHPKTGKSRLYCSKSATRSPS